MLRVMIYAAPHLMHRGYFQFNPRFTLGNLRRHIQKNPVVSRYINRLFNGHKESIT